MDNECLWLEYKSIRRYWKYFEADFDPIEINEVIEEIWCLTYEIVEPKSIWSLYGRMIRRESEIYQLEFDLFR